MADKSSDFYIVLHKIILALCFECVPRMKSHVSYFILIIFVVSSLWIMAHYLEKTHRLKIRLLCCWIIIFGILYVITLFVYYIFSFSPGEAKALASFHRYMATYMSAVFLIMFGITNICYKNNMRKTFFIPIILLSLLLINGPALRGLYEICIKPVTNERVREHIIMKQIVGQYIGEKDIFL